MDKKIYDIIKMYSKLENDLYFKLEEELGAAKAEELIDGFTDYNEQLLKIGKYLDKNKDVNREGYLSKAYEELPSYIKLTVIYDYESGYSLCQTTSGLIELIPTELIRTNVE